MGTRKIDRAHLRDRLEQLPDKPDAVEATIEEATRGEDIAPAAPESEPKTPVNGESVFLEVADPKCLAGLRAMQELIPAKKHLARTKEKEWVADFVQGGLTLTPDLVPIRRALGLLIFCLDSEENRRLFMLKIWGNQQDSEDERFTDDNRKLDGLIESALEWHREAVAATNAEGLPREIPLDESNPELWGDAKA